MRQKPPKRNPYAGPTTCLRCDARFESWDRRQNRLCQRCREALARIPSAELLSPLPSPRGLSLDD